MPMIRLRPVGDWWYQETKTGLREFPADDLFRSRRNQLEVVAQWGRIDRQHFNIGRAVGRRGEGICEALLAVDNREMLWYVGFVRGRVERKGERE